MTNLTIGYGKHEDGCISQFESTSSVKDAPEGKVPYAFTFESTTEEEAIEFASKFPKYCKLRVSHKPFDMFGVKEEFAFKVHGDFLYRTNRATGDRNETAEKRNRKMIEVLASINS